MIAGVDSAFDAPTLAQAQAFAAAGGGAWGGYLATDQRAGAFNLLAPWSRLAFWNVQQAGLRAIAFCSGWDDPAGIRALATSWGVLPLLDVEDGIRGDGPWVDAWLQASGAGLYGLCSVHVHAAPYRIVARYPGQDPGASWDPLCPDPGGRRGWQWQGTHVDAVTGLRVDSLWLDDGFALAAGRGAGSGAVLRFNYNGFIHRLWIDGQGLPRWQAIAGGSGGVDALRQGAGVLGTPPEGLTAVPLSLAVCDDAYQGTPRLSIECSWSDGQQRQAVVLPESPWTVIEDWSVIVADPAPAAPAAAPDEQLRSYLRGAPA